MNAFGDFQTPPALAAQVVGALRERGARPARILEPTCGGGSFLAAAAAAFPAAQLIGVEYQRARYGAALDELRRREPRIAVEFANAYECDFGRLRWRTAGPLVVVGNPPWVTAAALGRERGAVLQPPRSNPKHLRGLAARTGAANFDVAEFLLLKLLRELNSTPLHLAFLVKEGVARNVLAAARADMRYGVASAEIVRIDARAWFGVAVDACCLLLTTAPGATLRAPVTVRADFGAVPAGAFDPSPPRMPASRAAVFRQGIKHDAADVFELRRVDGTWRNGYGEAVDVEEPYVYPLLKARALQFGTSEPLTALIVPQVRLNASTAALEADAPRLWRYLRAHAGRLAARKSSIYRGAPEFALFGIGPYSFAPWKVAVAGLYSRPNFRIVGPQANRPVVFGDTAYFAPFAAEDDARAFAAVCGSPAAAALLARRVVPGKRPITKALLDGIDWAELAATRELPRESLPALFREAAPP